MTKPAPLSIAPTIHITIRRQGKTMARPTSDRFNHYFCTFLRNLPFMLVVLWWEVYLLWCANGHVNLISSMPYSET